jgi:hypothetical protein
MAWMLSTSAVVPAFAGLLGTLDGQHAVSIAEGRLSTMVILHHAGGAPGPDHRHTLLSGMLVALSRTDRDSQDHLLIFPRSEAAPAEDPLELAVGGSEEIPPISMGVLCDPQAGLLIQGERLSGMSGAPRALALARSPRAELGVGVLRI